MLQQEMNGPLFLPKKRIITLISIHPNGVSFVPTKSTGFWWESS